MNKDETKKILGIIIASYPTYKPENMQFTLNVWNKAFEKFQYEIVSEGLMAYIVSDKSGFAPSIGQLIDYISKLTVEENVSEMEAWDMVRKAIADSTYHSEERFNEFPEEVKRAVGSPANLRAWGTDMNYAEGVAQSNFIKTYRSVLAKKNERLKFDAIKTQKIEQNNKVLLVEGGD